MSKVDWLLKLSATAVLAGIVMTLGGIAIAQMGTLIHFNCRPQDGKVRCELTREPLIGSLETQYFDKTDLLKMQVEAGRLALVTRSQGTIPFTPLRSRSANDQLLAQLNQIEQFLNTPTADNLYVRTHRAPQLWYILGGLGLVGSLLGIVLWRLKSPL